MSKLDISSSKHPSITLLVSSAVEEEEAFPRLVSFPGGVPLPSESLQLAVDQKGEGKKRRRQVTCALSGLSYVGIDHGDAHNPKYNLCKYAVAKLDAGTGVMTLYPADHVYALRPHLISGGAAAEPERLSGMTADERRKSLTEEFGSSKKKRAMRQAASNSIADGNVSGASAVEIAITDSMLQVEASAHQDASEFALEQNRKLLLPPYNDSTTIEAEAYPLVRLMPTNISEDINAMYVAAMPSELESAKSKKIIPMSAAALRNLFTQLKAPASFGTTVTAAEEYLLEAVLNVSTDGITSMDKHEANASFKARSIALLYLYYLFKLYKILIEAKFNTAEKDELLLALAAPGVSGEMILQTFCTASRKAGKEVRSLSKQGTDKLLAYMLALGLHATNFSYNLSALAKDLGLPETNLAKIARTMGGKVLHESNGSNVLKLALPLKFPGKPRQAKK